MMKLVMVMESMNLHELHSGTMDKCQPLDVAIFNEALRRLGNHESLATGLYQAILLYNGLVEEKKHEETIKEGKSIAVDLDGVLAFYESYEGPHSIGEPVPKMVERVKQWLAEGIKVKIFTARASHVGEELNIAIKAIEEWCEKHIGCKLPITCVKDHMITEIWDDRAVQVKINTGEPVV